MGAMPLSLNELIDGFGFRVIEPGKPDARVTGVTEDSRYVRPGFVFVARAGANTDGAEHAEEASRGGVTAVVFEKGRARRLREGVAVFEADDARLAASQLAERYYGEPSRNLSVLGVTGTNGKTTVAWLTSHLLNSTGRRCGLISTVSIHDGEPAGRGALRANMTTPPAVEVSGALARMVDAGCAACAMETSSHALDQRRVGAVRFQVGVFTNLSGDHLDYHGTMDEYAAAKAHLFQSLDDNAVAVVNADDPAHESMIDGCRARIIRCSMTPGAGDATVTIEEATPAGALLLIKDSAGEARVRVGLIGAFNAMNALMAAQAAIGLGGDRDKVIAALKQAAPPPGRMQRVVRRDDLTEPVAVFVDYAHTDDALQRALESLRPIVPQGAKLWVVFGCGGDRDRTKRPRMGAVAGKLADVVLVTSDNPRTENPASIVDEVAAGVAGTGAQVRREVDREQAIRIAIEEATDGDVILIAGKGHEDYQILPDGRGGTIRRDFDDARAARRVLVSRFGDVRTGDRAAYIAPTARQERA